MWHDFVISVSY